MNPLDIYRASKEIAGRLAVTGRIQESDRIVNAIKAGFTSTEICMAVRHELREVSAGQALPQDLQRKVEALIDDIDRLLDMGE